MTTVSGLNFIGSAPEGKANDPEYRNRVGQSLNGEFGTRARKIRDEMYDWAGRLMDSLRQLDEYYFCPLTYSFVKVSPGEAEYYDRRSE